jgi:DNA repair protein RadC
LLAEFGSFPAVLGGSKLRLARATGDDRCFLALERFTEAMAHTLSAQLTLGPMLGNWNALEDYLRVQMAHRITERIRILHLNVRNILIRDQTVTEGTIDQAHLYVREVIVSALETGSAALILVHNHPSGDPSPSRSDIEITRAVIDAGKRLGICVHDHIIIGATDNVSLRSRGLI